MGDVKIGVDVVDVARKVAGGKIRHGGRTWRKRLIKSPLVLYWARIRGIADAPTGNEVHRIGHAAEATALGEDAAMIIEKTRPSASHHTRTGQLYLNGVHVGQVSIRGRDSSWHFGEFAPSEPFSAFAAVFGRWSLLMHADGEKLSEAASAELREAEYAIDNLRAKLRLERPEEWRVLRQLNIDGPLIEWQEA